MLHGLTQFFNNNPWLNVLFLLLAVFSIILTLIFYFKTKKEKLPTYSKKTTKVIQNTTIKSNKLEVKYNGTSVENLSITEFAFWNSGRETIKGSDIANNDALLIKTRGKVVIYDFEVLFQNKVNNFRIEKINETSLKILFDFIDRNQGVKIKIYHSGNFSSDFQISGTIIGADKLRLGIRIGLLANKLDILGSPGRFLIGSKSIYIKALGYMYGITLLPLYLPCIIIVLPIDYVCEKIRNAYPKEFLLMD